MSSIFDAMALPAIPVGDFERLRLIDRIRVMTFSEIRELGVSFVTHSWVAQRVRRYCTSKVKHCNGDPYAAEMQTASIGIEGRSFSDQSRDIIREHARSFNTLGNPQLSHERTPSSRISLNVITRIRSISRRRSESLTGIARGAIASKILNLGE